MDESYSIKPFYYIAKQPGQFVFCKSFKLSYKVSKYEYYRSQVTAQVSLDAQY